MKPKNFSFLSLSLGILVIMLSGCYRDKIKLDEKRALQHIITIEQAKSFQKNFIASHERLAKVISDSAFSKNHFNIPNAELFNRDLFALLLNQEGADGIRIYYGEDEKGQLRLVLLPVDAKGNDIVTKLVSSASIKIPGISDAFAQGGGQAGENGQSCPPCTIH